MKIKNVSKKIIGNGAFRLLPGETMEVSGKELWVKRYMDAGKLKEETETTPETAAVAEETASTIETAAETAAAAKSATATVKAKTTTTAKTSK